MSSSADSSFNYYGSSFFKEVGARYASRLPHQPPRLPCDTLASAAPRRALETNSESSLFDLSELQLHGRCATKNRHRHTHT